MAKNYCIEFRVRCDRRESGWGGVGNAPQRPEARLAGFRWSGPRRHAFLCRRSFKHRLIWFVFPAVRAGQPRPASHLMEQISSSCARSRQRLSPASSIWQRGSSGDRCEPIAGTGPADSLHPRKGVFGYQVGNPAQPALYALAACALQFTGQRSFAARIRTSRWCPENPCRRGFPATRRPSSQAPIDQRDRAAPWRFRARPRRTKPSRSFYAAVRGDSYGPELANVALSGRIFTIRPAR